MSSWHLKQRKHSADVQEPSQSLHDHSTAEPDLLSNGEALRPTQSSARQSKVPTGLGAEPLNIVILGASFAGLSCAHHFLDATITHLGRISKAPNYRLVIVSPSTHMYWNIGAPRALVSPDLKKQNDLFMPIEEGFHRHRGHHLILIQGEAVGLDTSSREVKVDLIGSTAQKRCSQVNKRASRAASVVSETTQGARIQMIPYHALIICTGSSANSDLLSLHGPHLNTIGALTKFHQRVAKANSIVVCGGACSGVETAGQLATYLNYTSHWPVRRRVKNPKQIILITGTDRCLTSHNAALSLKAERMLRRLDVQIRHNVRVIAAMEDFDLTGGTKIELNDNTSVIADLYIACTGVTPNSAFAPASIKDSRGYIVTNPSTTRVDDAGPRVYAIGDVASHGQNSIRDVYAAVPVVMHNLLNDLLAHELRLDSPYGAHQAAIEAMEDKMYMRGSFSRQLCPISRFGGVGLWNGLSMPKLMVHVLKGHDYRACKAKTVVVDGGTPYATVGEDKYGLSSRVGKTGKAKRGL